MGIRQVWLDRRKAYTRYHRAGFCLVVVIVQIQADAWANMNFWTPQQSEQNFVPNGLTTKLHPWYGRLYVSIWDQNIITSQEFQIHYLQH